MIAPDSKTAIGVAAARRVVIDHDRHAMVRVHREKLGRELVALLDIARDDPVRQSRTPRAGLSPSCRSASARNADRSSRVPFRFSGCAGHLAAPRYRMERYLGPDLPRPRFLDVSPSAQTAARRSATAQAASPGSPIANSRARLTRPSASALSGDNPATAANATSVASCAPQPLGIRKRGAARGEAEAFEHHRRGEPGRRAHQAQRQPGLDGMAEKCGRVQRQATAPAAARLLATRLQRRAERLHPRGKPPPSEARQTALAATASSRRLTRNSQLNHAKGGSSAALTAAGHQLASRAEPGQQHEAEHREQDLRDRS